MSDLIRQTAVEKLSAPPSKKGLLEFISWIDREWVRGFSAVGMPQQILARAVIAVGYELAKQEVPPTVRATLHAAEAYVLDPSEERYADYTKLATASYPFGSGDGCYAISEIGIEGCQPGSGCISGAGSLLSMSIDMGEDDLMQLIAAEVVPWLRGEGDPVAWRAR